METDYHKVLCVSKTCGKKEIVERYLAAVHAHPSPSKREQLDRAVLVLYISVLKFVLTRRGEAGLREERCGQLIKRGKALLAARRLRLKSVVAVPSRPASHDSTQSVSTTSSSGSVTSSERSYSSTSSSSSSSTESWSSEKKLSSTSEGTAANIESSKVEEDKTVEEAMSETPAKAGNVTSWLDRAEVEASLTPDSSHLTAYGRYDDHHSDFYRCSNSSSNTNQRFLFPSSPISTRLRSDHRHKAYSRPPYFKSKHHYNQQSANRSSKHDQSSYYEPPRSSYRRAP